MKKAIYLFAFLILPAIGMSQKTTKTGAKEVKTERTSKSTNDKAEAALMKQLAIVKSAIVDCDDPKSDCTIFDRYAKKIAKQPLEAQIKSILSSGLGSNFMTEMAKFEKMLMESKSWNWGMAHVNSTFKKAPSYQLSFVKSRIRIHEKQMEMVYDDEDDEE